MQVDGLRQEAELRADAHGRVVEIKLSKTRARTEQPQKQRVQASEVLRRAHRLEVVRENLGRIGEVMWLEARVVAVAPAVLDELLQRPERQLGVIREQTDATTFGVPIPQVVANFAVRRSSLARDLRLAGIAEGVADGEPEQHPFDAEATAARPLTSSSVLTCWTKFNCLFDVLAQKSSRTTVKRM